MFFTLNMDNFHLYPHLHHDNESDSQHKKLYIFDHVRVALHFLYLSPAVWNLVGDRRDVVYHIVNILSPKIKYLYPK